MKSFEILPHTADVRLKIKGTSLEEFFGAALEGMAEILKPWICDKKTEFDTDEIIEISAPDLTSLVIDFLSEVLSISHEKRAVFCRSIFCAVKFLETEERKIFSLQAKISGTKIEEFDEDIKAVTYHDAEVRKNEKGDYEIIITLDI